MGTPAQLGETGALLSPLDCDAQGAQGVKLKGPSPELAWPPQVGSYLTVRTCGRTVMGISVRTAETVKATTPYS